MPGRKKKRSSKCRKPPLIFSESPVEVSKGFASPVPSAANPRTADIISLDGLHYTTWVSPQFDLTHPPSAPRRKGRQRGHEARNIRTACSQRTTREMVADIGIDEAGGCNGTYSRIPDDDRTSDDVRGGFKRNQKGEERYSSPDMGASNKENSVTYMNDSRTTHCDNCLGIDMSLCSLVESNLSCKEPVGNRNNETVDMPESAPRNPLGNLNCNGNNESQVCHSCSGKCVALAEDTPVHEYNLRVSVRKRRGRLPKVVWDQLLGT